MGLAVCVIQHLDRYYMCNDLVNSVSSHTGIS